MTEKAAGTKIWCPFYRGVYLIWESVLRGSTVSTLIVINTLQLSLTDQAKSHKFYHNLNWKVI